MLFNKILVFISSFALGLYIIIRTHSWVSWTGQSPWAEDKIGPGGSYTLWKLIGLAIIVGGFLYTIGVFELAPGKTMDLNQVQERLE